MALALDRPERLKFDQLVEEGRALLPDYAPAWTDHNLHDPGITLMELFAWLVEMDLYRLDRVPPASLRAFLRLVGIELHAPEVAETTLVFERVKPGPPNLPKGLQLTDSRESVIFQTVDELNVSPARLELVLSGAPSNLTAYSPSELVTGRRHYALREQPRPGDALYVGFDQPLAEEPMQVSLYLWTGNARADRETWRRLHAEWQSTRAEAELNCPPGLRPDGSGWREHYAARTIWEYFDRSGEWRPLEGVVDETRGLTLSGGVRFTAPGKVAQDRGGAGGQKYSRLYFIRCRLAAGGYDCAPRIEKVALNAVVARHAMDADAQSRQSDGRAGQTFRLDRAPVVAGSTRLNMFVEGTEEGAWKEAATWDRAGPHDRVYVLSPETGTITFGNGRAGRVPPAGAEIRVSYQVGGGPEGNLPSGRLVNILPARPDLRVLQPYPAQGGSAAETLAEGRGRALDWLAAPHRAITMEDFEVLAGETPGVPVGRAYAIPNYQPRLPCLQAPGSVTVVVVPDCPGPRPSPSAAMLREVHRYLNRRRTVATELQVVGPAYITVAVHARLHPKPGAIRTGLARQARARLDDFFHPLRGGPDGQGWPAGRYVVEPEILALLNALPGVAFVDGMSLHVEGISDVGGGQLSFTHTGGSSGQALAFHVRLLVAAEADEATLMQAARIDLDRLSATLRAYPSGRSRSAAWESMRTDLAAQWRLLPAVLDIDDISLDEGGAGEGERCGFISICRHALVAPGRHQFTIGNGGKCDE